MKARGVHVAATVAGVLMATAAGAVPVSFTDVLDPDDVFVTNNKVNSPYAFVHDITDSGFNPLTDTLTSLVLTLHFRDDGDQQPEGVTVTLDDLEQGNFDIASHSTIGSPSIVSLLAGSGLMQGDGQLAVRLNRKLGDYWLMDSTLVAQAERGQGGAGPEPVRVPEPAMGFLAGLALVLAGLAGRRRPG